MGLQEEKIEFNVNKETGKLEITGQVLVGINKEMDIEDILEDFNIDKIEDINFNEFEEHVNTYDNWYDMFDCGRLVEEELIVFMYDNLKNDKIKRIQQRMFSYEQIKKISDENYPENNEEGLNRNIDYNKFNKNETFRPLLLMIHDWGMMTPRPSHIRVFFEKGVQDMTIEQYLTGTGTGEKIEIIDNGLNTYPYNHNDFIFQLMNKGMKYISREELYQELN